MESIMIITKWFVDISISISGYLCLEVFLIKHFLEELDEDNRGVEVEENGQGQRHTLDDDPRH